MMWTLLILGAVAVICFMYLFWVENLYLHMLMTALLAGIMSFVLFLIFIQDKPFRGSEGLQPQSLERMAESFSFASEFRGKFEGSYNKLNDSIINN